MNILPHCDEQRRGYPPRREGYPETIQKLNLIPSSLPGSKAFMPDVPGIDSPHVHWAVDADMDKVSVGRRLPSSAAAVRP